MIRVDLPLADERGLPLGTLRVQTRPRLAGDALLIDERAAPPDDMEPVQIVEGAEYRFEFRGAARTVRWEPREIFDLDDESGRSGRLRPRLSTGRVEVVAFVDDVRAVAVAIEVRSVKLDYRDDYRHMLTDIARLGSELVLERFAASEQRLVIDSTLRGATLYQRFVLLQALLKGERLSAGLRRIEASPWVSWQQVDEPIVPGRPLHGGSGLARRLARPGARMTWGEHDVIDSLPRELSDERAEESLDNLPNRFVKHALQQWSALVDDMGAALAVEARQSQSGPLMRGLAEVERLRDFLDEHLRHPVFADVGELHTFPGANQVLQKRDGYRDVLETHMLYEYGSRLSWEGGDDVFSGGQRDVATLYEYWVFLEMARVIADLCSVKPDLTSLLSASPEQFSLRLRRGHACGVDGIVERRGRSFRIELWFNREFKANASGGSWTRTMRPNCSVRLVPLEGISPETDDLWLHFDAKYRVDRVEGLDDDDEPWAKAKKDDLLKMHAYRDAIVRAAGAYVVYPGDDAPMKRQHDEVLPSLGAFPLRPGGGDRGDGADAIRHFLETVIDQLAEQTSSFERARFWQREAYRRTSTSTKARAVPFLEQPAADTLVLVGTLKSAEHQAWVEKEHLYNLRADAGRRGSIGVDHKVLAARLLIARRAGATPLLFRIVGAPRVMLRNDLIDVGYPDPRGDAYFVAEIEPLQTPMWLNNGDLDRWMPKDAPSGAPFVVSWVQVAGGR